MLDKKHKIISISLNDEVLNEIDSITKQMSFSGRSETIRAGIKSLLVEKQEREKLKGKINAVLAVIHNHSKNIASASHKYQHVISSHLHNHLSNDKCFDIFVLNGEASLIRDIVELFQKQKGIEKVRLTVC